MDHPRSPSPAAAVPLEAPPPPIDRVSVRAQLKDLRPRWWATFLRITLPPLIGLALAWVMYAWVVPAAGGFGALVLLTGINIVLAVSLNIVNGYAGQFSIGHAGFMSLGGYAGAAVVYYGSFRIWGDGDFHGGVLSWTGLPGTLSGPFVGGGDLLFLVACLVAGIVAAIAGLIVGLPSLRLRGDYLAIVTLGFGEIVRVVLQGTREQPGPFSQADRDLILQTPAWKLTGMLGGAKGFNFVFPYATAFWIFAWVALTLIVAVRLKYSSYGRALLSIREDEVAARAVGVNVTGYKVRAFVLSAFFAGVAGALFALQVGSINATDLGFLRSFEIVIMVVLGGLGSVSGAVLAAILLTALPELLRDPPGLWPWGLLIAVVVAIILWFRARRPLRAVLTLAAICLAYQALVWAAAHFGISLAKGRMVFYALALILMMILRPQGLLGVHELWDLWPLRLLPWLRPTSLQTADAAENVGSRRRSPAEGHA